MPPATAPADAAVPRASDPPHLKLAFELEGLDEVVGSTHERKILEFFAEAGHAWVKDDETAWCAAFVHAVLGRAGIKGTGSLAARSYLDWATPTTTPRRGDIAVFRRGTKGWQGHVAFFLKEEGGKVFVLGGNQGNAVSVASYPKSSLLGYRKVPGASRREEPKPVAPATPKPAPAPEMRFPEKGAQDDPTVEKVQARLRELGYSEVGAVDGDFGGNTENAILIFRKDNGLLLSSRIDNELLAALMKATPRKIGDVRAGAPPAVVREQAPEVKASWQSKISSALMGGLSIAGGGVTWLVSNFSDARSAVKPVADFFGGIPIWAYAGLIGIGFFTVWFMSRKAEQKGVEAYQAGERR